MKMNDLRKRVSVFATHLLVILLPLIAQAQGFGAMLSPGELATAHKKMGGITDCTNCHTLGGGISNDKCMACHEKLTQRINAKKGFHGKLTKKCIACHADHKGAGYKMILLDVNSFQHNKTGYTLEAKHITDCAKCHKKKETYLGLTQSCTTCHEDVHKSKLGSACLSCHDFQGWKTISFVHDRDSLYKLTGKHEKVACEKCHLDKTFRVSEFERCQTCHKKDDVHKGRLGDQCKKCHTPQSWKKIFIDHSKTKYPLKGKHIQVSCQKCHLKGKTKIKEFSTCSSSGCHQDPHKSQFKKQLCASCHTVASWRPSSFSHNKKEYEGYRLQGKHQKVLCQKCHVAGIYKPLTYSACNASTCHNDPHNAQFKDATCESCHTESEWKPSRFSHNQKEYKGYTLKGKHEKVLCEKCHVAGLYKPLPYSRCDTTACHSDPHKAQFKDATCESCHTEKEWKPSDFTHEQKKYEGYKLRGKHEKTPCEKCHTAGLYKPLPYSRCDTSACHSDPHKTQFKEASCESCHTESGWKPSEFSHERKEYKGYQLQKKHAQVQCEKCHVSGRYKPIPSSSCDSSACHTDPHKAQFKDTSCESCHTESGWKPSDFSHDRKEYEGYRLQGKHERVQCEKCHVSALYKPLPYSTCDSSACHNDTHKGELTKPCSSCHTEKDWKALLFEHGSTSSYPLSGKHKETKCDKCHTKSSYEVYDKTCISCHKDVHETELGKECDQCHTTYNWQPKSHTHEKTGFPLKAVHRQLECRDCHRNSPKTYQGTDARCLSCHRDPHFNQFGEFCEDCHDPSEWFPFKFRHDATGMQLRGAHRLADCKDCHQKRDYRNIVSPDNCYGCHANTFNGAPNHRSNAFSTDCMECHTTFLAWTFSHNSASNCNDCHNADYSSAPGHVTKSYSTDCVECHSSRAAWAFSHSFNSTCYSCHSADHTSAPKHVTSNYSTDCTGCHSSTQTWTFNHGSVAGNCVDCHSADHTSAPNHVTLNYSTDCTGCHSSTQAWTFNHGSVAGNCSDCHLSDRPSGHVSSSWSVCEECHTSTSSWSFSHPSTSFPLNHEGTNRNSCSSCHPSANYTNSGGCILCHQREGERVHETNNNSQCLACHPAGDD